MTKSRNQYVYNIMTTTNGGEPGQPVGLFLGGDAFEAMADAHARHPELDDILLMAQRYSGMHPNEGTQS